MLSSARLSASCWLSFGNSGTMPWKSTTTRGRGGGGSCANAGRHVRTRASATASENDSTHQDLELYRQSSASSDSMNIMNSKLFSDMFVLGLPVAEKILRRNRGLRPVIVGLRLAGKRELAQLNPFDLVVLLTLSNTVQNAIIGDDNSITGGPHRRRHAAARQSHRHPVPLHARKARSADRGQRWTASSKTASSRWTG